MSASSGVSAMDDTTVAINRLLTSSGKKPSLFASANNTNANSPPWPSSKPTRIDSASDNPNGRPTTVTTDVLTIISDEIRNATASGSFTNSVMSKVIPVVMKNRPSRSPRNGSVSTIIWERKSVSASNTPATNAPRVIERPSSSVNQAAPSTVRSTSDVNASGLRLEATKLNILLSSCDPKTTTNVIAPIALRSVIPSTIPSSLICDAPTQPDVESKGTRTRSGTTAISCASSTPNVAVPKR
mmetsp:Transcript_5800/g.15466  ORF Transcript_5800/g.15466 Transcript_5800/m.15466 type:complete len:242 (+) Transcript_5800:860-1585(+)